jgi:hypothetical protein
VWLYVPDHRAHFTSYRFECLQLMLKGSPEFLARHEATAAPESFAIRIAGMRTDSNAVRERAADSRFHRRRVTGVAAAGDVTARHDLQQIGITRFTLAEIGIQVYCCHHLSPLLSRRLPVWIDL